MIYDINGNALTDNFSTSEKTKLAGIASGAEVNVQSNWTTSDSTSDAFILNKPTLGDMASMDVVEVTS